MPPKARKPGRTGNASTKKDRDGLTTQQRILVQKHFQGMSNAEAYWTAHPSSRANIMTAYTEARRTLSLPQCQRYLGKLRADAGYRFNVSTQRIIDELAKVAYANSMNYLRVGDSGEHEACLPGDLTEDELAAVASVETEKTSVAGKDGGAAVVTVKTKFKLHDKLNALEKLGRQAGMFREQVDINARVEIDDVTPIERARRIAFALASAGKTETR